MYFLSEIYNWIKVKIIEHSNAKIQVPQFFDKHKKTIVIVAGYGTSQKCLVPLQKFLSSNKLNVYTFPLKRVNLDIDTLGKNLTKKILKIPAQKIEVIGISLGGLIVSKMTQNKKAEKKITKIITLGSPFKGCYLGTLLWILTGNKIIKYNSRYTKTSPC